MNLKLAGACECDVSNYGEEVGEGGGRVRWGREGGGRVGWGREEGK